MLAAREEGGQTIEANIDDDRYNIASFFHIEKGDMEGLGMVCCCSIRRRAKEKLDLTWMRVD